VRSAVIYATLVVALVFFPVITLSGVAGRLFAPMGYAYVLATMASLVVALTVTPALSALLLARPGLKPEEPRTYTWLRGQYRRIFVRVERSWRFIIAVVTVSCILTLAMIPFFKTEFLPELREGHYIVHTSTHPGTALSATLALGKQVNTALLRISGVRAVAQQAGRAVGGIDVDGTHYSEFHVDFSPGLNASAQSVTYRRMIESLNHFPGMDYSVQTFLTERVQETIAGAPGQFVVSIYGPNLDALDAIAQNVASTLRAVPGATGVTTLAGGTAPSLTIRLRADRLAHWGLTPVDVLSAVQTAYQGTQVAQVYDENQVINVAVMLDDASRSDVASVAALSIRTVDGAMLRLGDLATITQEEGRFSIRHYGGARLQVVSTNVSGVALGDFAPDAREAVTDHVELPAGYYFSFGGEPAAQEQARHDLLVHGAMTFIGIAILLSLALPNPRAITLLLVNIPFSLIGGVLAVAATGSLISLGSLVGFVTLLGITLRNSIMLLFHFERLTVKEGLPWDASTALKGASERLVPIVMTALATGLALLPLAVTSGEPGNEIEGPMAIVILGGLCTSTLLNLVVLPSLALRFVRFDRRSGR
jgi:Cu/Ag efflux pump CusA